MAQMHDSLWTRIFFSMAMLVMGSFSYWLYILYDPLAPRGGSWLGLIYGLLGYALMLYLVLPGLGREVHAWPPITDTVWRSGHPWLGLLCLPLILFHAGFNLGGIVSTVLMILFAVYVASGLLGWILQRLLTHLKLSSSPLDMDFTVEKRLHLWLHGWLVFHIPISAALVALSTLHAILSLWY
jgi:hypothetical protein